MLRFSKWSFIVILQFFLIIMAVWNIKQTIMKDCNFQSWLLENEQGRTRGWGGWGGGVGGITTRESWANLLFECPLESLATFSDGFNFKIRRDSFNFRWYLLAVFPTNEKQDVSAVWQWQWQCFLMTVALFSVYFKLFSLNIDFLRC